MSQPRVIPGRKGGVFDRDTGWMWTRGAIVRLLAAGFESDSLPNDLRQRAWLIVQDLVEDPNPTPEEEAEFLGQPNSDPHSLSINTIRGEAMHAVVQYALWVRRWFNTAPDHEALAARGFEEMPEVRQVLERHLDPKVDSSLTARSVYGRWLPHIHFLDRRWVKRNLALIFPADNSLQALYDCVWSSYIVLCDPYNDVFRDLEVEYLRAIARIGKWSVKKSHLGDPDVRLGQHLLTLFWRGVIPLPTETGPLQQFYANASDALRGDATGFIGRTLKNDTGEIPAAVMERLRALWETRIEAAQNAGKNSSFQKELTEFGWWFVSNRSNAEWSLDQLLEVLKITKKINPDIWVVEGLAELSADMVGKTVQCLGLIVDGDEKGWGILGWKDDARKILSLALASEDQSARQLAREIIHRLGGRGYFEFRDLLTRS